ncbi:MAG: DUF2007 domain-containing protein [bacterium]|nr:MAG: DUF2007 domain-containing protein [bacterium]
MKSDSSTELVELTTAQGEMEAEIIRGVLEGEDIKVLVKSDVAQGVHPFTVDGLGKVRILVRKRDFMRAKVILKEYRKKE